MRKILQLLFVFSLSVSSLLAQDKLSVLLVQDNSADAARAEKIKAAITTAGYTYTLFDAASDKVSPSSEVMSNYELVLWYAGYDQTTTFWGDDDNTDNEALKTYLDNGGMLWLQSSEFLYDRYPTTPVNFVSGDFAYDYLGIKTYVERGPGNNDPTIGVPQYDLVAGNPVTTVDPLEWSYNTMWRVEVCEITDDAQGVYNMGPSTHTLAQYFGGVYNETANFKVFTLTTETARLKDPAADYIEPLFLETLDYFNQFANTTKTAVTSFSIVAPTTTVSPYGTLQLSVDVLPVAADNKSVAWAIVSGETSGSIDGNGLFTPTSVNGTVVISATTNDGSNLTEEITITVEDKLSILFIHDSDYNPGRADVLKAAITTAGYHYAIFDAVAENNTPSVELLSAHELVIWYTGDDQDGTHLWNGDNTDNAALKTYLDNGGMFWLQGKSFLNERYAVDDVFVAGDFVYDYLGISKYAIRTPGSSDVTIGIPQFDLVTENNFTSTVDPLTWVWGTMYTIDAFEITASAKGIYVTGPSTHQHASYCASVYNEVTDGFKALTTSTETGKLKTVSMTNQFVLETLDYFNQFANTDKTSVATVTISATDDAIVLDLSSTLQFSVAITPADASNLSVTWSINEDANASIKQTGVLTSTDIPENVIITATANDGSKVSDTYVVEIKSLIPDSLSILLVQDNSSDETRIDVIKTAITTAGYGYTVFDAVTNAQAPSAEFLSGFELVIWYTGNDEDGTYLWNGDKTENAALKSYLDNGGMLWLQGLTFLYDRYGVAPVDFVSGDFAYDYLGLQKFAVSSYMDDSNLGVSQLDLVAANGICTIDPLYWLGDATMNYVAGCELLAATQDVYQMGPTGYALAGNSSAFYNEVTDGFKALSFTFDPSQLKTNLNPLYEEVLDYFNDFANTSKVHVYEVAVSSESGAVSITEENGTLQLVATVLPEGAENKTATWSLGDGSVPATISPDGLLTASGTIEGNGPVFAIATSNDKPEFADTLEISIIGQAMTGFTVLLVNDNDGSGYNERYLNINTALTESGYTHILYNTETAGSAPSADYMSHFDMVFWYTGNDYIDLYLWDVSDTTANGANAVKANSAIIDYIDNGGIFFHSGLEIMRDIFGRPDDDLGGAGQTIDFAAGDYVYDYMGVSQYIRSGKNDDGISQIEITAENVVTTTSPISFAWSTLWHGAGYAITDNATALYKFPTSSHEWSEFPTIVMNEPASGGTVISNGSELAMLGDGSVVVQETVNDVTKEFIDYFANYDPTSINNIERNTLSFSIYPNPTSDDLNIKFAMTAFDKVQIIVFDNTGHRVIQKEMNAKPGINNQKLNVRNLSSGIYFMSIHTNNSISSSKFIID